MASTKPPDADVKVDPYEAFRRGRITYATYREYKRQLEARSKNGLCSICRQIDFQRLYSGKRVDDPHREALSTDLGTLEQVSARALACIFCRWICQNIAHAQGREAPVLKSGLKKIRLCCDGSTIIDGREQGPHSVTGHLIPIVRLRQDPYLLSNTIADLRLIAPPRVGATLPEPLTGEFVDRKTTTIEQLTLWLKDCISVHEHRDDHLPSHRFEELYSETLQSIPEFTLIDVATRSLVTTKALKRVDGAYIALSYVWGPHPPTITLGPDNTLPSNLPSTIEDALTLVSALEFIPFLWIDSICIPQNNLAVRLAQIQKMDLIYDRAMAALIVTGDSVTSGINGFSTNNFPSQSLRLGPYLLTYQPGPWTKVMATHNDAASHFGTWGTRAWTFQEALMSRRRIIVNTIDDRVLFECSVNSRQTHPTDAFEQVKARFFTDLETIRRKEQDDWNIHWYAHLLNLYLQRQLSFDRDIISAFAGVARVVSRSVERGKGEGKTCWNLPRRDLLAGLMWAPTKNARGLVYREKHPAVEKGKSDGGRIGVLEDGRRIPSWHWASVVMREGVAFVQGSEPLLLYKACRDAWMRSWTDEIWEEVERTGMISWRGRVVDFERNLKHKHSSSSDVVEPAGVGDAINDQQEFLARTPQPPSILKSTSTLTSTPSSRPPQPSASAPIKYLSFPHEPHETPINARQNALTSWKLRRGSFISCPAWKYACTTGEVKEPLAIYAFAQRLGVRKSMEHNRVFVLGVEWVDGLGATADSEWGRARGEDSALAMKGNSDREKRVCKRVGWAVVDLEEWRKHAGAEEEEFWLA